MLAAINMSFAKILTRKGLYVSFIFLSFWAGFSQTTETVLAVGLPQSEVEALVSYPNWVADNGQCSTVATTLVGSDNQQQAFNYFVQKGLTAIGSAAVLGNLMQESHVNPKALQSNGVGHGIAQWSQPGRWDTLLKFAKNRGQDPYALATQLDFMWAELTESQYTDALGAVKNATDIAAATAAFENAYEKAGTPQMDNRINYAKQILQLYATSATNVPVTSVSTCNAGAVNCTTAATGATATLSVVRQNVVCIAQQELAKWTPPPAIPRLGYLVYSQNSYEEWCADFVSWVYDQAKYPLKPEPGWRLPAVSEIMSLGQQGGKFHYHSESTYIPRLGDMVIHKNGGSHVNLVVGVQGNSVTMIGGDQGSGPYGGHDNAAVVSKYTQSGFFSGTISGYVSPD